MFEASVKVKYILFFDAFLFLLCIGGIISVSQKASLPFELSGQDSLLTIIISENNLYDIENGNKLISIDESKITSAEKAEFITDKKNISDIVSIGIITKSGFNTFHVRLTRYYTHYYLISTTLVAILFFLIALFVLVKKPLLPAARIFHWASICITLMICFTWANLNVFSFISKHFFRNILHIVYTATPALFFHFTLLFPRDYSIKWKKLLIFFYLAGVSLSILNIYSFSSAITLNTDPAIDSYLNYFNLTRIYLITGVILSISFFISAFLKEKGDVEKNQLKWVLFGFIIGPLSFILLWVIPILLIGKSLIAEELIIILQCSIPITFAISIIKYHLLNIDEILNRSIVYAIVISIFIVIYSATLGIFVSYFHSSDQSIVSAIAAIVLALFFQPLKTFVQRFVDKKFFRIRYNFRKELTKFSSTIKNFNDVDSLGNYLVTEIDNIIPVEKIAFSRFNHRTGKLIISHHRNFDQIARKSLRIKKETLERKWFEVAAVQSKVENEAVISTLFQNTLVRWNINLVVPIKSVNDELFGFIILGNKKSGSRFTMEDVDLLKDIGINAGSTIERISLQEQLIREKLESERLEELNKQKSMFVSSVSHELKTPLTSIKIFAEMLQKKEKDLSEKSKGHLEIIEGETDRLTRLINNVLDFSKIEKGVKEYSFREVHFNKIVKNVIELMQYTLKMKGFNLNTEIDDFNDLIYGDADAITEAVENLISNAIRFSTNKKEIVISTFYENNFVCVRVKDNGIGIDPSDINKIFDPFFRSKIAKLRKIEGTGLGLPIVKHIVEEHKGKILIDSIPGEGSVFTLCFPIISNNEGGQQ